MRLFTRLRLSCLARLRGSGALVLPNSQDLQGSGPLIPLPKQLCLFAHYDPAGEVSIPVLRYWQEIKRLGFGLIVVTTSPVLSENLKQAIKSVQARLIWRKNVSLDFGSWKTAIDLLGGQMGPDAVAGLERLWLTNDSVYGPFRELDPIFAEMRGREADLWGLTSSDEIAPHLQSYFLIFEPKALKSPFFADFWRSFHFPVRKKSVISRFEVGLSRRAQKAGLKLSAWVSGPENPTLFRWAELIRAHRFPFIKTEILRLNRFQSPEAEHWQALVLSQFPNYPVEGIETDLARFKKT